MADRIRTNGPHEPTRRTFLRAAGRVAAAVPAVAAPLTGAVGTAFAQAGRPRNIVFIFIDDQRYDALSCLGHPIIESPHIDTLATSGIIFNNTFVTTSLCSPSRASILSGQYAHTHGVLDNSSRFPADTPTFPQMLQRAGYRTGFVGKWHMGGSSDAPRPGFDRWVSFRGQGPYFNPTFNIDGDPVPRQGYTTDLITDYAVDFVRENRERPFFLYMSHKAVHADFQPAPRHRDKYADVQIPYPASMADTEENYRGKPAWVRAQRNSWHGVDGMYNHTIDFDRFYRDYCRTMLAVDESVGRLADSLEELGLLDETLILYMGDNGFQFGEHGLIDKRTMYEASIRVPCWAHCPALTGGGRRLEQMALNIDVCPTILEAAGLPVPETVQGRSLLPLIENRPVQWRTEFLYEYFWERAYPQTPTVLGLRTDRYSYMRYHGTWDMKELYDVRQDPDQMHNLLGHVRTTTEGGPLNNRIQDPALRELVRSLDARLFKLLRETGALIEPSWQSR